MAKKDKFKRNLLIAGVVGVGVGILYLITSVILAGTSYKFLTEPLLNSIGLPFKLTIKLSEIFGYSSFGYLIFGIIMSLLIYFFLGILVGAVVHIIKRKK